MATQHMFGVCYNHPSNIPSPNADADGRVCLQYPIKKYLALIQHACEGEDTCHVFLGEHEEYGICAIKEYPAEKCNEVDAVLHLNHKNINKTFAETVYKNRRLLIMEPAPLGDLFTKVTIKNGLCNEDARCYTKCILRAVEYVHDLDLVCGDLSPEHVLIYGDNVKLSCNTALHRPGKEDFFGVPVMMAPETIKQLPSTVFVDYWMLGCLTHFIVMNKHRFHEEGAADMVLRVLTGAPNISLEDKDDLHGPAQESFVKKLAEIDASVRAKNATMIHQHDWIS